MINESLQSTLEATGFLAGGEPASGVLLGRDAQQDCRGRSLQPDAVWTGTCLTVYFKDVPKRPSEREVAQWQRDAWNHGFAPLLWVISPDKINLYNGFARPVDEASANTHLLREFERIESELDKLDAMAGHLAMATGKFWTGPIAKSIDRRNGVDHQLLSDLAKLEEGLLDENLPRSDAQALIGRAIFTQYLLDRKIISTKELLKLSGYETFAAVLKDTEATSRLFGWLKEAFNGDMFLQDSLTPKACHLRQVANFLEATDPHTGQTTLFPYQFDVIPVEVISSIYEQFARAIPIGGDLAQGDRVPVKHDVFYTPVQLVSLVLDEIMVGLSGKETVLDLTCGSAVFLVEALRRLSHLRAGNRAVTGALARQVLREQIYGVDISEAAVRVAAFSLYLAALELDPHPRQLSDQPFEPLIGRNLIVGDAWDDHDALMLDNGRRRFDLIVGNPPWSDPGKETRARRRQKRGKASVRETQGDSINFAHRAMDFAADNTRIGLILSGNPFFSQGNVRPTPAQQLMEELLPLTLVNLGNLKGWLFTNTQLPAMALVARHRTDAPDITTVQVPWSPSGAKTGIIDVSPSDMISISREDWQKYPRMLKAAFLGSRRDLALLARLNERHDQLKDELGKIGAAIKAGLGGAGREARNAEHLCGKPFLDNNSWAESAHHNRMPPFALPRELEKFQWTSATWPREAEIYQAPLALIKEYFAMNPRPVVIATNSDVVYADAFHGVSFAEGYGDAGEILAAIWKSSLAAWFLLMTSSSFGTWMQRIKIRDLEIMPIPDLVEASHSSTGDRLRQLVRELGERTASETDYRELDEAVFDLYELENSERVVVRDGLFRASWQWKDGLEASAAAVSNKHLLEYAGVLLDAVSRWLAARKERHMRTEVFDLPASSPVRVVRLILEDGFVPPPAPELVSPGGNLRDVLNRIGSRLRVQIGTLLYGQRELRVHGRSEVVIIKPNARRHWLGVRALEDADAVILDSWTGRSA